MDRLGTVGGIIRALPSIPRICIRYRPKVLIRFTLTYYCPVLSPLRYFANGTVLRIVGTQD